MPLPPPSAAANRVTASSVNERCSGSCLGRQRETTESRGIEHRGPPDRQARTYRTVITGWRKPNSFSASEICGRLEVGFPRGVEGWNQSVTPPYGYLSR